MVKNNNQIMCLANEDNIAVYNLDYGDNYGRCYIENAYGGIDCDKDGKLDIEVYDKDSATLYAGINDKAAIKATKKGKTYTIPVTAELTNRDGVSENMTIIIKLKVIK